EAPTPPGVPLDEGQVLGCEEHGAQRAQYVAGAGERGAVQLRPVGLAGRDLQLDQRLARVADDGRAQDRPVGAEAHQRLVGRDPVAGEGGDVADRLDEVGLALAVEADEGGRPRLQRQIGRLVAAEVTDAQVPDVHGGPQGRGGCGPSNPKRRPKTQTKMLTRTTQKRTGPQIRRWMGNIAGRSPTGAMNTSGSSGWTCTRTSIPVRSGSEDSTRAGWARRVRPSRAVYSMVSTRFRK